MGLKFWGDSMVTLYTFQGVPPDATLPVGQPGRILVTSNGGQSCQWRWFQCFLGATKVLEVDHKLVIPV